MFCTVRFFVYLGISPWCCRYPARFLSSAPFHTRTLQYREFSDPPKSVPASSVRFVRNVYRYPGHGSTSSGFCVTFLPYPPASVSSERTSYRYSTGSVSSVSNISVYRRYPYTTEHSVAKNVAEIHYQIVLRLCASVRGVPRPSWHAQSVAVISAPFFRLELFSIYLDTFLPFLHWRRARSAIAYMLIYQNQPEM